MASSSSPTNSTKRVTERCVKPGAELSGKSQKERYNKGKKKLPRGGRRALGWIPKQIPHPKQKSDDNHLDTPPGSGDEFYRFYEKTLSKETNDRKISDEVARELNDDSNESNESYGSYGCDHDECTATQADGNPCHCNCHFYSDVSDDDVPNRTNYRSLYCSPGYHPDGHNDCQNSCCDCHCHYDTSAPSCEPTSKPAYDHVSVVYA